MGTRLPECRKQVLGTKAGTGHRRFLAVFRGLLFTL